MDILREYQIDIMLLLAGICGIITLFVYMTNTMSHKRKVILMLIEIGSMLLMISDRRAYIYRGDPSQLGYVMVRLSNFLVFFLTLAIIYSFNLYLIDLYTNEGGLDQAPRRLSLAKVMILTGIALLVISQFTGLYYTFDETNHYQRAPGFFICYLIPLLVLFMQLSVIIQYYTRLGRSMRISLLLFTLLPILVSGIQLVVYGISLNNLAIVSMAVLLYVFALQDLTKQVERAQTLEMEFYKQEKEKEHALFEETAEALASAIDAKDKYTHGHSNRVALYSSWIAREAGKSGEECEQVYFAGLLHDVGKIGINDAIINKDGRLTDEEFAQIKMHPVYGNQILSSIHQSPYLSIGAHFHHERYDGRGYPDGLKGEDIPDIARMISVADAYDAMTSKRSYRDPIPQQLVREEMVKGMGTQFDPEYAKIMLHLIDLDIEYDMRERESGTEEGFSTRLHCETIYRDCTSGILLTDRKTRILLDSSPDEGYAASECLPSLILFDALDARVHVEEAKIKNLLYLEYGQIRFDGRISCKDARKMESEIADRQTEDEPRIDAASAAPGLQKTDDKTQGNVSGAASGHQQTAYEIEAVRVKDHALIYISDGNRVIKTIIALPDSVRFAYLSLTGEHCSISNIQVWQDEEAVDTDYIPRIAEEVSYIKDCPEGDIPNVQIDGWRLKTTEGIPLKDTGTTIIRFHTRSLPTARLIWHCPFVSIYTSEDGSVSGDHFREFLLLRLDGENWESDEHAENKVWINQTMDFAGWNKWKEGQKEGLDCQITIKRRRNKITITTENLGISISGETTIKDDVRDIYAALTGDQCAITDIRISE